jgi:hypothetical protein
MKKLDDSQLDNLTGIVKGLIKWDFIVKKSRLWQRFRALFFVLRQRSFQENIIRQVQQIIFWFLSSERSHRSAFYSLKLIDKTLSNCYNICNVWFVYHFVYRNKCNII